MCPSIQQIIINFGQLLSSADLLQILKYIFSKHNQHWHFNLAYASKFRMPYNMTCKIKIARNIFVKFYIIHKIDYVIVNFRRRNENKHCFWTQIASQSKQRGYRFFSK